MRRLNRLDFPAGIEPVYQQRLRAVVATQKGLEPIDPVWRLECLDFPTPGRNRDDDRAVDRVIARISDTDCTASLRSRMRRLRPCRLPAVIDPIVEYPSRTVVAAENDR